MPRRIQPELEETDSDTGVSKTQRKQAMHDLQDLADALIELPETETARIEMEDGLRAALQEIHSIRSFEARRRQAKYIGKLLRQMDAEPLQAALDAIRESRARETRALRDIERWRDRLLADDAALTEFASRYRDGDLQALRAAIRSARRETASQPPNSGGPPVTKGRYYRELFKLLRDVIHAAAAKPTEEE
jgi:ribosome-associated protein